MPFHQGFFSGVGDFLGGIGRGVQEVLSSPFAGEVAGAVASIGVEMLRNKVLGTPVRSVVGVPVAGSRRPAVSAGIPQLQFRPQLNPTFPGVSPVSFGGFDMPVLPGGAIVPALGNFDLGGGFPLLGAGGNGACPSAFRPTGGRATPLPQIWIPNPVTGEMVMFKPAGRILLTSSDITAHKRVNKLARMAARRRPR